MIEKKKWDYLADIRARTGAKTLYINSTPHGVYQFERLAGFLDIRLADLLLV